MPCYRLFFRDPANGRFLAAELLGDCIDDRVALHRLADVDRRRDIELWERDRLVAVVKSERQAA